MVPGMMVDRGNETVCAFTLVRLIPPLPGGPINTVALA